jgi:glycosyltransferase involved in cell wall biosynthesis
MRIFSVFFHPSSSFTAVGGAEKRFLKVLKVWCDEKVNVTVVDPDPASLLKESINCEIVKLTSRLHASRKGLLSIYLEWVLWVIKACFVCPSLARRRSYDVVLAPNNTLPNLVVAYAAHIMTKRPLCVIVHHLDFPYLHTKANLASIYRVYRKAQFGVLVALIKSVSFLLILNLLRRSNLCITVSDYTANVLLNNGMSPNKVRVSGNGIDIDYINRFQPLRTGFEGVFVGRIARDKGVFDLVRIWHEVNIDNPEYRLAIVGSGPDLPELESPVRRSGISGSITLFGNCNDSKLYGLMKASKIFLFPSMFEGWGMAVGEALACGLPVVCYDIPALREIFGECRSVFFVPIGDSERLAKVAKNLLRRNDFESLTSTSKAFVKRFGWRKVALRDLQIISALLQGQIG